MNIGGEKEQTIKLLIIENTLRIAREEGAGRWAKWVTGIKVGTCDDHWM